jgi:hypothetical protein
MREDIQWNTEVCAYISKEVMRKFVINFEGILHMTQQIIIIFHETQFGNAFSRKLYLGCTQSLSRPTVGEK